MIVRCGDRDEAAARATVEQDWRRAVAEQPRRPSAPADEGERVGSDGNGDVIFHEAFAESLSELVDVWAVGTSGEEYKSFLRTLFLRVTRPAERTEGEEGGGGEAGVWRDPARRVSAGGAVGADAADGGPANRRPMRPLRDVRSCDERPSPDDVDDGCVDGLLDALSAAAAADMRSRGRRHSAFAPIRDPAAADVRAAAARAQAAAQLAAADAAAASAAAAAQRDAEAAAPAAQTAAEAAAAAAVAAAAAAAEQKCAAASRDGRRASLKGSSRRLSNPAVRAEVQRRRSSSQPSQVMMLHGDEDGAGPTIAMFDRPATGSTREVRLPSFGGGFAGAMGQRLALPDLITD